MPPPIVIVGAGIAGLSTAVAAAPRPVIVLSRGSAGEDGATHLAQGGIAAALGPGDTPLRHARDTLDAGAGCNDRAAVALLTAQAPAAIAWLQAQGVAFDGDAVALRLGREGGHDCDRIVHAGGDSSGRFIAKALAGAVRQARHIQLWPGLEADALRWRGNRVIGIRARDQAGRGHEIEAAAVVMATGGIGALFARTSNPAGADGAGLALGLAAGAAGRDLEFVQFHPTALAPPEGAPPGQLPLISEAVRGAGASLCDGDGRPLMAGVDPRGDLAPRDIVSRRIWQARQAGMTTWLDARCVGAAWPRRFPTVFAICQAQGIDPREQPIPVLPAAHFHMGGLRTDLLGRTSVPGLYAVGEVACNGVHGANRLASNSLLEGVVFGRRLGAWLARNERGAAGAGAGSPAELATALDGPGWRILRELMWRHLGPLRTTEGLTLALSTIAREPALRESWPGRLASALFAAALKRGQSLGAHHRSDARPSLPVAGA